MSETSLKDAMFDTYMYETSKQLEKLEKILMQHEENKGYAAEEVDEIFRIMHTIKGASSMMGYQEIAHVAHSAEDLFCLVRNRSDLIFNYAEITDLVLECIDYMKYEIEAIGQGEDTSHNVKGKELVERIRCYMQETEVEGSQYMATLFFEECCEMEDLRAYEVVNHLKNEVEQFTYEPDINEMVEGNADLIREKGFVIHMHTKKKYKELKTFLEGLLFVKGVRLDKIEQAKEEEASNIEPEKVQSESIRSSEETKEVRTPHIAQSFTSISFEKLDKIMNLLGEMVVAEAMVLENPDLLGLNLSQFEKAARRLSKITGELQDEIISLRLVPVETVFQKMHRVVREMNKKLGKKVQLKMVGEDTEIDKKVVDFITDPIMHMVRNAIDHGIEMPQERNKLMKREEGTLILEAKNDGGEVFIKIIDDGRGLNKEAIIKKAIEKQIITEEAIPQNDDEVYKLIFKPGFSTKESTSEYSGRGVGMDVVTKNIEAIGGNIQIESQSGIGTSFMIKIPLTMAIIDGMTLRVGEQYYTIPTRLIKESFRPQGQEVITKPNGDEMIILRGECLPIIRLYKRYNIRTDVQSYDEGIVVRLEQNGRSICLFVDEIIGQQQVVIKSLPRYILNMKKVRGISGCTLLGDGTISLILDFEGLLC